MMVYFVRHGESEGNVLKVHQDSKTPLSEIGKSQAEMVAHRFKHIPIDIILTSDYVRTVQTAEVINLKVNKNIEPSPLLQEFRRPTEILSKKYNDPLSTKVRQLIKDHRDDPAWHYSDEENFFDFELRARKCLRMISDRPESKILCVTHGLMLSMLLSVIIFENDLTPIFFEKIYHRFHNQNTGISICKFEDNRWQLITWNDHTHLG